MLVGDILEVAIPLKDFASEYQNFCDKQGYKSIDVKSNEELLKKFKIKLVYKADKDTKAYSNIVFKTNEEQNAKSESQNADLKQGSVARFLATKCTESPFDTDYILQEDLERAYADFCSSNENSEIASESLRGSKALVDFGTSLTASVTVTYI